ncbi:retrovirus polyprotein [Ceratocystis lukuohia]|uniref:Retrovirus polyprotein n=1 Tax=Ceratocystis lukuohia TaxID=2019550 RepID=A0ABR4M9Y3_9PEZI
MGTVTQVSAAVYSAMVKQAKKNGRESSIFVASLEDINKALQKKKEPTPDQVKAALPKQYADLWEAFAHAGERLPPHKPGLDAKLEIEPGKEAPWGPLYQMSRDELLVLRKTLTELVEKGFIRTSSSPAGAPVLFARKPGGGLRFCVDYRALNAVLKRDRYPIPLIQETLRVIAGAKWLTKLDVRAAFHRIRIEEGSEWKTAFRTRYGSYEWMVMPFGLANGPSIFQRYINHVLREFLDDFASAYIDDIIIYSKGTRTDHQAKVRKVLQKLKEAELRLDLDKCEFEVKRVKYLGMIVTAGEGVSMDPEKTEAIREWKPPTTVKGVRGFLGFANYYRDFIRDFSTLAAPLVKLTKKDEPFVWSSEVEESFQTLKAAFQDDKMLGNWDSEEQTWLETDASGVGIGAVLSQGPESKKRPIAFFSRKMNAAEQNYGIHDKELLAVIEATRKWRGEVRSLKEFTLIVDHKNLEYFRTKRILSERQVRWMQHMEELPPFTTIHRPGRLAVVPDALSRKDEFDDLKEREQSRTQRLWKEEWELKPEVWIQVQDSRGPFETDSDLKELWQQALQDDEDYEKIAQHVQNRQQFPASLVPPRSAQVAECEIQGGVVKHRHAIWVPNCEQLRGILLQKHHNDPISGHGGRDATAAALRRQFFWPGLDNDVKRLVRNCDWCGRTKPWREKLHGLLKPLPIPNQPWQGISMDFMTHLPGETENLLVVTCRLTGNVILVPLVDIETETVIKAVITHVYAHHGTPRWIVSDRGQQWVSEMWKRLCEVLGIERKLSTAYHPQTDGGTERANQEVLFYLRTRIAMDQEDWPEWIPLAQLSLNNRPQPRRHGVSPFFLTHGYNIVPVQIEGIDKSAEGSRMAKAEEVVVKLGELNEWAQVVAADMQQNMEVQANRHRSPAPIFKPGDSAWLKMKNMQMGRPSKKLDWLNAKYKVVRQVSPLTYELDVPGKIHKVFHVDLLRPAAKDPWPGQNREAEVAVKPIISEEGHELWEVDEILCAVGTGSARKVWVKWTGFGKPTAEPIDVILETNLQAMDRWEAKWGPIMENDGPKETYLTKSGNLRAKWARLPDAT